MNRKSCRGCVHYRRLWDHGTPVPMVCHYMLDTGKARPCPAAECTVKAAERTPRKKTGLNGLALKQHGEEEENERKKPNIKGGTVKKRGGGR